MRISDWSSDVCSSDLNGGDTNDVLAMLKSGLTAPLSGMGTAFSSSLLGLSGSLILGFLDIQAGRAQNRFYTELENWLSSVTDLGSDLGAGLVHGVGAPEDIKALTEQLRKLALRSEEHTSELPSLIRISY